MKAITTQATNLAQTPLDLESDDALLRVYAVIDEQSKTRNGGQNFNSSVLFAKAANKIKSLAGNIERLPDTVAAHMKAYIAKMPENTVKRLADTGFEALSLSSVKVNVNYRTSEVSRRQSMLYKQQTNLETQIKDIKWKISQAKYRVTCLDNMPVQDSAKRTENENKMKSIEETIAKDNALLGVLLQKQAELNNVPTTNPAK